MIMQLRAEIAQLRDQVQGRSTTGVGGREGDGVRSRSSRRGGAEKAARATAMGKAGPRDGENQVLATAKVP
jgi:hypothetical protein